MSVYRLKEVAIIDKFGLPLSGDDKLRIDLAHMNALETAAAMYADDPLAKKSSDISRGIVRQTISDYRRSGSKAFAGLNESYNQFSVRSSFGDRRPERVSDVVELIKVYGLMPGNLREVALALRVLLPKIRSQKATGLSSALALRSSYVTKMYYAYDDYAQALDGLNRMQLNEVAAFLKQVQVLKLVYKKSLTQERIAEALEVVDPSSAIAPKERAQLSKMDFEGGEAALILQASSYDKRVGEAIDAAIRLAYAEANLEMFAHFVKANGKADLLHPQGANFMNSKQLAALLDYAAPTVIDAYPLISDELETPAVDRAVVEKIEASSGPIDSKDILKVSDKVVRNTAQEIARGIPQQKVPVWMKLAIAGGLLYVFAK